MRVLKHLPWGFAALAAAICAGVPTSGRAALVSETFTDPFSSPAGAGNFTQSLVFSQFDSNLGQLQSITIDLAGSGFALLSLVNLNNFGVAYTGASSSGNIVASALGLTGLLANVTTGTLSGTAAPGLTTIQSSTQSFDVSGPISAAQFAAYTGTGTTTVDLNVGPFAATVTYGLPPHSASTTLVAADGDVSGTVSVTYNYDNSFAVPEPSTMAVFGSGILLLGFMRRHQAAGASDDRPPPGAAA